MRSLLLVFLYPLRYLAWQAEEADGEDTRASVLYSRR
jgi:hypothetical protein